jgi:hypothetical protein
MVVPDEIRKCVIFIGYAKPGGEMQLAGTAFLVGKNLPGIEGTVTYLVTARHILKEIVDKGAYRVSLRVNVIGGGFHWIDVPLEHWSFHPEKDLIDVAVLPISLPDACDHKYWPIASSATPEIIAAEKIGIGNEAFLVGLFHQHSGTQRNIPIVRVGNIAAMPEEMVMTTKWGAMDAYLLEARSIGGISGSPVFAYVDRQRHNVLSGGASYFLLGLMHGHWDKPSFEGDDSTADAMPDREKINTGIAIVVPFATIAEVLGQKKFVDAEAGIIRDYIAARSPIPDYFQTSIDTESVTDRDANGLAISDRPESE